MTLVGLSVLLSSVSFFAYVADYFRSPHMKNEFKRLGMEKLGLLVIVLELMGAIGLLVGLVHGPILTAASLGLALLMVAGLIVRVINKDSLVSALPAFFFLVLNGYIAWASFMLLS